MSPEIFIKNKRITMEIGISTASMFSRLNTEDALQFFAKNNLPVAEVFLESYCEYNKEFGRLLKSVQGGVGVHSIHALTTQFEPQLYSLNERAKADSFKILKGFAEAGEEVKAKYYTFHGGARFKKTPFKIDYERVGKITQDIIDTIKPYGISLAYENVHWGYYNYIGFFKEIKARTSGLKGTLDVKQARQSGIEVDAFINEMAEDIVTVHLSDVKADGKMCLPNGKGITDFELLFKKLRDVGFDGSMLIEVYKSDFNEEKELFDCVDYLNEIKEKVF